jgi:dipeptide transport system ATP-binding protein
MTTVLEARGLARHYEARRGLFQPAATVKALAGVSFTLEAGRTLAVVGESGCGKSTLARLLTMIETPTAGSLLIDGVDVAIADAAARRKLRREIQIVFQNPYGSLNPRQTVGAALEEPLRANTDLAHAARAQAAREMMERVGLRPEFYDRYPHMFSGGQRQRIAIARALMLRPRILVLDEPVSALDVSIRAQVLNLLADLQESFQLAYVFVSHDLSVVRHIADRVMVIYLGHAVETGPRDRIFGAPCHPYTRALLSATPMADPTARRERIILKGELPSPFEPPTGCVFHPRCPLAEARCSAAVPLPTPVGAGGTDHLAACFVTAGSPEQAADAAAASAASAASAMADVSDASAAADAADAAGKAP